MYTDTGWQGYTMAYEAITSWAKTPKLEALYQSLKINMAGLANYNPSGTDKNDFIIGGDGKQYGDDGDDLIVGSGELYCGVGDDCFEGEIGQNTAS